MHTCRSDSTKQDLLHRTVDVAQMRSAFEFTCDHLDGWFTFSGIQNIDKV